MIKKFLTFFAILMTIFSVSFTLPGTPVSAASCPKNYKCYEFKVNSKKYYIATKYTKSSNKCSYKYLNSNYKEVSANTKKKIKDEKAAKTAKEKATKYCKNQKSKNGDASKDEDKEKEKDSVNTKPVEGFTNGDCSYLLGMVSWNCNVDIHDEDTLKSGIWTIVANILTDLTVVAAYLVIGYVFYGGYQYILSNGDPGKVANGKKTLVQAFIGLAIVMLSNVILNTIRIALGNANFSADCTQKDACMDPGDMVTSTIQWVIGVAGVVSAVFIIVGGISYITSHGDPSKLQKAKQTILYALIGLALVALAEVITAFVSNMIRTAEQEAFNNLTTIAKEVHEIQTN